MKFHSLIMGFDTFMRKKVTARHNKVLHQKDAILLDNFLRKKESRIFCKSILLGKLPGFIAASSLLRLNSADQTCRSALKKVPRVIHKTKEVHFCD